MNLTKQALRPALTAERSFFNPAANFLITSASEASASSSQPSSFSPSRARTIPANFCVSRRASAKAASEVHNLWRYSFYSAESFSSRRINSTATFFAVGDVPAMTPFLARGTADGGLPAARARLSSATKRAQVSSLWA